MTEVLNPIGTPDAPEPGATPGTDPTPTHALSTSKIDLVVESVITLINGMGTNFANIRRGALGTVSGLCCEIAPSMPQTVFYDKNSYITLTLALNGKHHDMRVLDNTLNNIYDTLTRMKSYPSGSGWEIVDITGGNITRIIGREDKNLWIAACDLVIKFYRKDDEPE